MSEIDVHQNCDRHDVCRQRTHAVTHQRQRDSRHRHDARRHSDIDEHMEGEHRGNSDREQASEHVDGFARDLNAAPHHDQIQNQKHDRADKAEFFSNHGEDKVRVIFRQKIQLTLRAFKQSLAE